MFYGQSPYQSYERPSFGANVKRFITNKSPLNRFIVINAGVFLVFWLLEMLFFLFGFLMVADMEELYNTFIGKLSCPASLQILLKQPWSIVTSLFIHANLWHLLMNMLMLYITGKIFLQYLDRSKFVITYFLGGIAGNLLYIAAYQTFPVFESSLLSSHAVGASGSIMAIMAAIATYRPNHELNLILIGRIKLIWIVAIFVFIDMIGIPKGNAGGHIAHLGGVLYGFASLFFYDRIKPVFKREKKRKIGKKRPTTSYHTSAQRPLRDEEYNALKAQEQQKLDEILDKISKNGYESLTKSEKDFLFNYGKR